MTSHFRDRLVFQRSIVLCEVKKLAFQEFTWITFINESVLAVLVTSTRDFFSSDVITKKRT